MTLPPSAARAAVASMLALDAVTLEVVEAFAADGISTLLMKGPVTSRWLYDNPLEHPYTDVDLLVAPSDGRRASRLLVTLGFRDYHASVLGIYRPANERAFVRSDGTVDLHTGLVGIPSARAEEAWQVLHREAQPFLLHGRQVQVLHPVARALQLALHAAQATPGDKALVDLRRGLARVPEDQWGEAARLADTVGASAAFAAGLARVDRAGAPGPAVSVGARPTAETLLRAGRTLPESVAIASLAALPPRQRLQVVRRWLSVDDQLVSGRALAVLRLKVLARMPLALLQWGAARRRASRR
jgi:hypothetical protein